MGKRNLTRRSTRPARAASLVTGVALAVCAGCSRGDTPAAPASQPAAADADLTLLVAGWDSWTREEALARIDDPALATSAALRLIRLSQVDPLCAPAELSDRTLKQLQVVRLDEECCAMGLIGAAPQDAAGSQAGAARNKTKSPVAATRLAAPVLIDSTGSVHRVADGVEEETLLLRVSDHARVFPHLLVSARRVWIAACPPQPAMALMQGSPGRFDMSEQGGFARLRLVVHTPAGPTEVARYGWDGYEGVFAGPAADNLPDPPGGTFQIDMEASPLLQPVGGRITEPTSRPRAEYFPRGVPIFFLFRSPDWR